MNATIRLRDLADEWQDMGEPVKLRRSTVYMLCDLVDDAEELLDILKSLEATGASLSTGQRSLIKRTRNELEGLNSRGLL